VNLDDFIVGSLEPGPPDAETVAMAATDGEAAALAPELARTRDLLGEASTWAELPAGMEDALVAAIAGESANGPAMADAGSSRAVPGGRSGSRRRRVGWWSAVPAAAAAALVVGVVVADGGSEEPPEVEVALAGTELAPQASATAQIQEADAGVRVELDVDALPPAEPGTYYQAWLVGPNGAVALGTFHLRSDRSPHVVLWSGVDARRGVLVTVTIEPDDGDPAPSSQRDLEGRLDGAGTDEAGPGGTDGP
jgi:hypothetical protein